MRKKDLAIALSAMLILAIGVVWGSFLKSSLHCINIFYDQTLDNSYSGGRQDSIMLQGLLIYFPEYAQIIRPVESYRSGDLDRCPVNFYIGSYRDNRLPQEFLQDYVKTKKNVAWIGYNIWQLGENLPKSLGVEFVGITVDDEKRGPAFFRDIIYKGEIYKRTSLSRKSQVSAPPTEQVILRPVDLTRTQILAESKQRSSEEVIPYIIRTNNYFYIADIPFSYRERSDRYLVFVDLLFDILGTEVPRKDLFTLVKQDRQ
ncbi:hypothetical protein [Bdellovibrio sp. HCB2-146]|uniref:hypothetical protein n=1 Tax=Bdellovibrio sp. HCB2-146 TaxID=3394362 RepID=UPI0039BD3F0F